MKRPKRKVTGQTLANAPGKKARKATDYYATPPEVTEALLAFLQLHRGTRIWEPACGEGVMSRELKRHGYHVRSTNLHDQGFGGTGVDFTTQTKAKDIDWIITNPPFSLAAEFIKTALALPVKGVAILVKSQFWHASSRYALFELKRPEFVLPLTWRPDFLFGARGGSPTMECIWTVWMAEGQGLARYHPLKRPSSADA